MQIMHLLRELWLGTRHAFEVSKYFSKRGNVLNATNFIFNCSLINPRPISHLITRISLFPASGESGKPSFRPLLPIMSVPNFNRSSNKYRWVNQNFQKPMDQDRLVWVDLEMTGLDIEVCHIIEIACIITDGQLNIIEEGPNIVIHQPDEVLESMNEWCVDHHGKSGLTEASRKSSVSLKAAEMEVLSFVRKHTPAKKCPLAGNTVHADKEFLVKYMPDLMEHLHYRIVDVSTVKELCRRWYPAEYKDAFTKKSSHRALDDIKESIEELKHYRKTIFK